MWPEVGALNTKPITFRVAVRNNVFGCPNGANVMSDSKIMSVINFRAFFLHPFKIIFNLLADMRHSGNRVNYGESDKRLGRMHYMKRYD
jgi:hypothetical protein